MANAKAIFMIIVLVSVGLYVAAAILPGAIGTLTNSTATGGTLKNSNVDAGTLALYGLLGLIAVVAVLLAFIMIAVGRGR